jgi:uncharacterized membrane protein
LAFAASSDKTRSSQLREVLVRAIAGGLIAVPVTLVAHRMRALTASGALSAAVVGTMAVAAGPVVQQGGERNARQVLANGGVYALSAFGYLVFPSGLWYATAIGALAASTADTWATEVGTLFGGQPISITSGKAVPPGTSGGVTTVGTMAAIGGAVFIAAGATLANWPVHFAAVALAGIAGAQTDSLLGATLQARRWCEVCAKSTERLVHTCGAPTRHAGGVTGFDNDAVNVVCSCVGALVALLLS